MDNKTFMQKALSLAAKGKNRTSPNPMVGAVIVKGDKIIAADYHRKAGTPHAEILALKKAGSKARGAALYINLEPCCHTEKKTPPCTKFITKKEPFVILKIAQSIDGKIATSKGESRWITGEEAREYVHRLRNEVDAVLVGIGTVRKDNPSLDCRIKGGRNPYRIIVDSNLQIPLNAKVLKHNDSKTIIAAAK